MRASMMIAALLAGATALPALAQTMAPVPASPTRELPYDRGYDKPSARTDAINAQEGPVTDGLNAQAGAAASASTTADIDAKAVYEADREAYWRALMAHDRSVLRTDERYIRQQNAYADAMVAWRLQDAACKRGNQRACKAPTPTPEQFY